MAIYMRMQLRHITRTCTCRAATVKLKHRDLENMYSSCTRLCTHDSIALNPDN